MRQISKHLILFLFLTLVTSSMAFARKPAVEPVTGISIDQYDDVAPSKATPFKFGQEKTKNMAPAKSKKEVKQTSIKDNNESKSQTNKIIVILMVSLLPIAVWLGLMKGIKDLDEEKPENVFTLHPKKGDNDDDDMNFPKAS